MTDTGIERAEAGRRGKSASFCDGRSLTIILPLPPLDLVADRNLGHRQWGQWDRGMTDWCDDFPTGEIVELNEFTEENPAWLSNGDDLDRREALISGSMLLECLLSL